jgi:hypothetical protein
LQVREEVSSKVYNLYAAPNSLAMIKSQIALQTQHEYKTSTQTNKHADKYK